MILNNKLDTTFGPFGSSTGFFLLLGGIAATYFSLWGVLLAAAGAFAAFTTSGSQIDSEKMRARYYDKLFGIVRKGKWIDVNSGMSLGIKKSHRGFTGYIRGTQPVGIHENDFRIYLFDKHGKPLIPLKKSGSPETLKIEMEKLSALLGLPVI